MMKKVALAHHVPSRTGRELQRYYMGRRQVVGCIPYRFVKKFLTPGHQVLEVLMVSSQKGKKMLFPKGGWEKDESKKEAALRETLEEAGVIGSIQSELGQWMYKSKSQDTLHDVYMFSLLFEEQFEYWPEKDFRQRRWVKVTEAKELCAHIWMKEALDLLVQRLTIDELHANHTPDIANDRTDDLSQTFESRPLEAAIRAQQNIAENKNCNGFHRASEPVFRCSISSSYVCRLHDSSALLRSAVLSYL
ncbi:hypothetical protein vseg_000823 [Gypsophila vaccaria]